MDCAITLSEVWRNQSSTLDTILQKDEKTEKGCYADDFVSVPQNSDGERDFSLDKNKRICITGQVIYIRNVNKIAASMNATRTCSVYTVCNSITPQ